jgi:hypothetical protein
MFLNGKEKQPRKCKKIFGSSDRGFIHRIYEELKKKALK